MSVETVIAMIVMAAGDAALISLGVSVWRAWKEEQNEDTL